MLLLDKCICCCDASFWLASREQSKEAWQEAEIYLKEVTDRLQESLVDVKVSITSSAVISIDIAGTIIQQAEDESGYDLIAMTTHGRSGLRRLMMGSVTEHVLGATKLPLLIVRPHKVETQVQPEAETETEKGTLAGITEPEVITYAMSLPPGSIRSLSKTRQAVNLPGLAQ